MQEQGNSSLGTVTKISLNSLFIYVLSSTANGQIQSQYENKQQQDNTGRKNEEQKLSIKTWRYYDVYAVTGACSTFAGCF
jgi:hypothetical protein